MTSTPAPAGGIPDAPAPGEPDPPRRTADEGAIINTYRSTSEISGRDDVNDIDSILLEVRQETEHLVEQGGSTRYTWEYEPERQALTRLYEKAKTSQWNASTDLDWSIEVDQDSMADHLRRANPEVVLVRQLAESDPSSPMHAWDDSEYHAYAFELLSYLLSNLLHGEQGAFFATTKIAEQTPGIDAKYYAATQVADEARHVEVFSRYLREKLNGEYPITPHLQALLDDVIEDSRWDMTYLGMQIMVEGLALAAFGFMRQLTNDPLLAQLLRYVMSDEARHVAFGTLSLGDVYTEMSASEIRERQEFAFEAGLRMRDRGYPYIVWERLGLDSRAQLKWWMDSVPNSASGLLFSKIVPNIKKLGLLDAGDGWLRRKYEEIDVIQFEDWTDSVTEYDALDGVAEDRLSEDGLPGDRDTETAGR